MSKLTPQQQLELEAATFRKLVAHLDNNKDVQNIDLMITADFCRNCLSKWYKKAADERDIELEYSQAQQAIYKMPAEDYKAQYQTPATAEQLAAFEARKK
jgi:hypothetical protein